MPIGHISDTARLTAYARALEADRPDALFRDPYARRLAGSEGETLAAESGASVTIAAAVAARTAVFDELVMRKVHDDGVDLVVNLAAGLDTRPWRLDLPPRLRWIDVDLPDVLSYKRDVMYSTHTACAYEAVAADIANARALDELLERCGDMQKVLIVTEGLLVYLTAEQVGGLARQLHRRPAIAWWITDVAGPRALKMLERSWGHVLQRAPFQFAPANSPMFFSELGWRETEFRSSQAEARRLGRAPRPPLLGRILLRCAPASFREEMRRLSGCAVLCRRDTAWAG